MDSIFHYFCDRRFATRSQFRFSKPRSLRRAWNSKLQLKHRGSEIARCFGIGESSGISRDPYESGFGFSNNDRICIGEMRLLNWSTEPSRFTRNVGETWNVRKNSQGGLDNCYSNFPTPMPRSFDGQTYPFKIALGKSPVLLDLSLSRFEATYYMPIDAHALGR